MFVRPKGDEMASCEKCWREAGGDPVLYRQLLRQRRDNPCTLEEQAGGEHAGLCESCQRRIVHCVTGQCLHPDCKSRNQSVAKPQE